MVITDDQVSDMAGLILNTAVKTKTHRHSINHRRVVLSCVLPSRDSA